MKKYLLNIIYWAPLSFTIFFIFIFPLIFSSFIYTYNVFELIKTAFLWPAVLILCCLTLIKIWAFKINIKNYINNNFLFIFLILFLFLLFNTLFIANNYELALFGDYNRRQGLFTQLSYLIFFCLLVLNLLIIYNYKKLINYLLFSISFSGFLVALYGLIQYLGYDYFIWQETVVANRVISSIGQPNFLASFLVLSLGASFYCLFTFKRLYFKLFFLVFILMQLLTIYLSSSRSSLIALILAFFVSFLIFIKKRKNSLIYAFSTIISISILIFILVNFLPSNRFSQIFNLNEGSSLARKEFYRASLEIIKERPLLGHGLEQAGHRFVKYYKPDWALFSKINDYPDRAHNIVLDTIINIGIIGFLVYLLLFSYFFYFLFKKNTEKNKNFYFLYLGLLAYITSLMFSFSSLATSFYFWSILSIIFSISIYDLNRGQKDMGLLKDGFKYRKVILILLIIFNIFLIYLSFNNSIKTIKADQLFLACQKSLINNNVDNFYYCWQALELSDDISQRNYYYVTIINYYIDRHNYFDNDFKEVFDNYLLSLYARFSSDNYELMFTKAKMACYLKNDEYIKVFNDLIIYSPKRPVVYYSQANCYSYLSNFDEAINSYKMALSLLPDIYDSRLNEEHQRSLKKYVNLLFFSLGQTYVLKEDYEKAIEYFMQAYYNNPEDINIFKNIGQANYLLGNYYKAIDNYLFAWGKDENNYYWPLVVSKIYNELGDSEKTDFYFEKYINLINN